MFLSEIFTKTILNSRSVAAAVVAAALTACGGGGGGVSDSPVASMAASNVIGETMVVRSLTGETRTVAMSADAYSPVPANSPFLKTAEVAKAAVALRPTATVIELPAPPQAKVSLLEQKQANRPVGVPLQIGFSRPVQETADYAATAKLLAWSTTASGGRVAAIELKSLTAQSLRIGVSVKSLPDVALLRFYAPDASKITEVTGQKINQILQVNKEAGDTSDNARTYWGPNLQGERGILEIELPAGADPAQLAIAIPNISHAFIKPLVEASSTIGDQAKGIGSADVCQKDVSCETPLPPVSNAVALMSFVDGTGAFQCTGTLLNDTASSGIPYFLTANHCISNQTAASSLETRWFVKSSSCNSGILSPNAASLTTGATLLWTRSSASVASEQGPFGTDTTFLRLNSQPPAGVMYAGWTAAAQTISSVGYAALHHPRGDLQKISKGTIINFSLSSALDAQGSFTVQTNSTKNHWPLYRVTFSSGITEGGSSGGGLFAAHTTNNPKLVGQLLGGGASCSAPAASDFYGRFDIAYQDALYQWLSPTQKTVFRFYSPANGTHFFTMDSNERNVVRGYPGFSYEGPGFMASPAPESGLFNVYRFYSELSQSHFYTIDENEKNVVQTNYPQYRYEGIAWYARKVAQLGWVPLYRFYRPSKSSHFYTTSEAEKNSIIQNQSSLFNFEGIAYYVRPIQ
jgi:lysyl endopeptidase